MQLAIAVPTGADLPLPFVKCLLQLYEVLRSNQIPVVFSMQTGAFLPHTRAKVCGASLERGVRQIPFNDPSITHLMMIDSDICFEPLQVARLLQHNLDFVAGAYAYQHTGLLTGAAKKYVAGFWDEPYFQEHYVFPCVSAADLDAAQGLVAVDWVGLGFVLVKTSVFGLIDYPWFSSKDIVIPAGGEGPPLVDSTSEDVGFCLRLREAGVKLWLDPTVRVRHLKSYEV